MNKAFWTMIGRSRARLFTIVVVVNAFLATLLVMWLIPQEEIAKQEFQTAEQKKLELQNQIVELPKKYEQMQKNEAAYEALQLSGFFAEQDRVAFQQVLNDLRVRTGIRQVEFDIGPQQAIENQALVNTDKQLLSSQVSVTLKGWTDLEMRSFVQVLQQSVPGVNAIRNMRYARDAELNGTNLVALGNGQPVDFVTASYSFNWYTLANKVDPLGIQVPVDNAGMPIPPTGMPAAVPPAPATPAAVAPMPVAPANPAGGQ